MQPLGEIRGNENGEAPEISRISILFLIAKYVSLTEPSQYSDEAIMSPEQYIIINHNNEWKISFSGMLYGPYCTKSEAIEASIDAAYAMCKIGIAAEVLAQDSDNNIQTEWTLTRSFYAL